MMRRDGGNSIPIVYEMIPGAIVTVFLVDESDSTRSHLASNSLDIQVDNRAECQVSIRLCRFGSQTRSYYSSA